MNQTLKGYWCFNLLFTCAMALPTATTRTMGLNKKSPTANGSAASMIPENLKRN